MIVVATAVIDEVMSANYVVGTETETEIVAAIEIVISEMDPIPVGQMNEVDLETMITHFAIVEGDLVTGMTAMKGTNHCKIGCVTWPTTEIAMNIIVAMKVVMECLGVMDRK